MSTPATDDGWDWAYVYERCLMTAHRFAAQRADAEDIAQDAALRAWRRRASCRTPQAPEAWLASIARNEALRRLQREGARETVTIDGLPGAVTSLPDDEAERTHVRVDVQRALGELSAEDQLLLRLRYVDDLTQPAVAAAADLPEGTAKVRLHRLRHRLKARLED